MHQSPHPNQIRSSCQRCRRQKLRCSRQRQSDVSDAPCTRCTRLDLECVAGAQGKVGRPSRKIVRTRPAEPVTPASTSAACVPAPADAAHPSCRADASGMPTFGDMACGGRPGDDDATGRSVTSLDWALDTTGCGPSFMISPVADKLPQFNEMSLLPEISLPISELNLMVGSPDPNFVALSRVNVTLYSIWEIYAQLVKGTTVEALIDSMCELEAGCPLGTHAIPVIPEVAQEYLRVIKSLHHKLGVNLQHTVSRGTSSINQGRDTSAPILDSPTAFLIISCFCQLTKILETTYAIVNARIGDPDAHAVSPRSIFFAGVAVVDFAAQGLLFTELIRHVFRQSLLILGLPGASWPSRTTWTGLLAADGHREMLNAELGAVEGLWSMRPARVMEMMDTSKELLFLQSMAEYT